MKEIDEIIGNYIKEYNVKSFEEFNFIYKLVNIVRKHKIIIRDTRIKNKVDINKSFKYSYDFFKSINKDYADYLLDIKDKGLFYIEENKEKCPLSSIDSNGYHYIYLPIQNNIMDTYAITHETIHDMSAHKNLGVARHFFCEALAIEGELLQKDYFEKHGGVKEYRLNNLDCLDALYVKNSSILLELDLMRNYLDNGYIDEEYFKNCISIYDKSELNDIALYMEDIIVTGEILYGFEQRYIIGYLIASYMHDRILNDKKKIQEFIELNDNINSLSLEDVFNYLDLEYIPDEYLDLTDDSYKKLEKSFVNELKRR